MSRYVYAKRWNRVLKQPMDVMSAQAARRSHETRTLYCVVADTAEGVRVVEMCFTRVYCNVLFLDSRRRVAARYSFVESGDQLFLKEVALHAYADGEVATEGELYRFSEEGTLIREFSVGRKIEREEGQTEVQQNYSNVPEFGDYEELLGWDR